MKTKIIGSIICMTMLCSVALMGCGKDPAAIATINGDEVSPMLFHFYLSQVQAQFANQQQVEITDEFWETTEIEGKKAIDYVREKALDEVTKYILIDQKAKERNLTLSADQKTQIANQKTQTISNLGGQEGYKKALKDQGITEEVFQGFLENNQYATQLMELNTTHVDEAAAKVFFDTQVVCVKHVLISTVDDQQNPLPQDQVEAARKKAEEALAKAKGGTDFDTLVKDLSQDPGSASQPDGYYLGKGFALGSQGGMVPEFETAALALPVGGISDIVETSFGYHIIRRYPNQASKFESSKDEILYRTKNDEFQKILGEWKAAAKVVINEAAYQATK